MKFNDLKYKYTITDIQRAHALGSISGQPYCKTEICYSNKRWGAKNLMRHLNRGYEDNPVVKFTWVREKNS